MPTNLIAERERRQRDRADFLRNMCSPEFNWVGDINYGESQAHKRGEFFSPCGLGRRTIERMSASLQRGVSMEVAALECRTLWFEIDPHIQKSDEPLGPEVALILKRGQLAMVTHRREAHGLPSPTYVVDSGGKSIHVFWRLDASIAQSQWCELQRALIYLFTADVVSAQVGAVARVGGGMRGDIEQRILYRDTAPTVSTDVMRRRLQAICDPDETRQYLAIVGRSTSI